MDIYKLGLKDGLEKIEGKNLILSKEYFGSDDTHLVILNIREFKESEAFLDFPERAVFETEDGRQIPNVEFYENLLFMTLNDICWYKHDKKSLVANEVNIFLGKKNVFIVKHEESDNLNAALGRIDKSNIHKALYTFIDALLDNNKRLTSEIEQLALVLEENILNNLQVDRSSHDEKGKPYVDPDYYMEEIVLLRKHLQFLKTYYEPTADVIEILEADDSNLIPENYMKYFLKLSLKADRASANLVNLRDYIAQVREAWQAQVDLGFNKVMKIFTVITAIFLPLTLIAGWYGMNFRVFPEIYWDYGYHMVIILSVAVVAFCLWIFRRNHYI